MSMNGELKFKDATGKMRTVSASYPLPTAGGGGSGSTGLTNAELRATPVPMVPTLGSGSFKDMLVPASVDASGAVTFAAAPCHQATVANTSNEVVWIGDLTGPFFPVFPRAYFTFFGLSNLNKLKAWCTQEVTLHVRVES